MVIQIYYMSSGFLLFIHNFSLQISEEPKKRYAPAQPEHTPRFTYLLSELLQQSVELLLQHCLCCGTYELINELAVLEEEQGRDSAHTVV